MTFLSNQETKKLILTILLSLNNPKFLLFIPLKNVDGMVKFQKHQHVKRKKKTADFSDFTLCA